MKQVERDLIMLSLISDYMKIDMQELIHNIDRAKVHDLFMKTFKGEEHVTGILKKLAYDAYGRIEKKIKK